MCGVFYRGNDKQLETIQPSYSEFVEQAKGVRRSNPGIKFLVQTDQEEFLEYFLIEFPDSIYFSEIPRIKKNKDVSIQHVIPKNVLLKATQYYLASVKILSECREVIHTSGNGELWMVYFRGHTEGTHQYLQQKEFIYGQRLINYENRKLFWY